MSRCIDLGQVLVDSVVSEGLNHPADPLVVVVEVEGSENGSVTGLLPQFGNRFQHILFGNVPAYILTELSGNCLHFGGDGCVFGSQVRMVAPGIHDHQGVSGSVEVVYNGSDNGFCLIAEVDGHNSAVGTSHLVHQTTGFAEVFVLGVLSDLGDLCGGYHVIVEQGAEDCAHKDFQCRRGAEA